MSASGLAYRSTWACPCRVPQAPNGHSIDGCGDDLVQDLGHFSDIKCMGIMGFGGTYHCGGRGHDAAARVTWEVPFFTYHFLSGLPLRFCFLLCLLFT